MSFETGSGDLVKARDSPQGPRSKDLDGVPHNPTGIDNVADERAKSNLVDILIKLGHKSCNTFTGSPRRRSARGRLPMLRDEKWLCIQKSIVYGPRE